MRHNFFQMRFPWAAFQLHAASLSSAVKFRKKLSREQLRKFLSDSEPAIIVMEACGSAHYWARHAEQHGHEVKLIAAQYVKPFVKRQKRCKKSMI